ncbi:MAG TPA: Hsp70 family protein, partial [Acidimicrobiales bacterium]|nr:Hsp70 family protein [Acidimicrobiales bacterium]
MADSLGIDLGRAACAAARRDGEWIEPCRLASTGQTAPVSDLLREGTGADAGAVLRAITARALGGDPVGTVAVAGDAGMADAARALFPDPVLVPRAVAAAAWHLRDERPDAEGVLAVIEAEAREAAVSVVECGPEWLDVVAVGASGAGDIPGLLVEVLARADLAISGLHGVVIVGGAQGLHRVRDTVAAATGLPVTVDAEPTLAVAFGAALLAGDDRRRVSGAAFATSAASLGTTTPWLVSTGRMTALGNAAGTAAGTAAGDRLAGARAGVTAARAAAR